MNREEALELVKPHLTEQRYIHTLGVEKTAIELARQYGVDPEKASLAAIFHDYAKVRDIDEMRHIIIKEDLDQSLLQYHPNLWHATVGAVLVNKEMGIDDPEILGAITFHTTGQRNMSPLEKVIFVADYIEPNREFPGVEEARELAKKSLDEAVRFELSQTMIYLIQRQQTIFPDTFEAYNMITKQLKEEGERNFDK